VPKVFGAAALGAAAMLVPVVDGGGVEAPGGASPLGGPRLTGVECLATDDVPCPEGADAVAPGGRLRLVGEELQAADRVVFRGAEGELDDVAVRVRRTRGGALLATVSRRARSGPLEALAGREALRGSVSVTVADAQEQTDASHVFPIDGPHDLGQTATNSFGGGRGHQGQDMFADCGTPMVAAASGTVRVAESGDPVAGNHLVLRDAGTGDEHVYMHLDAPPRLQVGDDVNAGERIGSVGQSGNAQGCHLHFEIWSAPGWQRGEVRDPLPTLRRWKAAG
jgi:murein DD-endopeptidase MepM/ murein hydrolase activator NlpD